MQSRVSQLPGPRRGPYVSPMAFTIPPAELTFRATRARGPGGQHVNKTSTRVEVVWDVARTDSLTGTERARVLQRLAGRIDRRGRLRVACEEHRSQTRNRAEAVARLERIVRQALRVPRPRKKTRRPAAADARRIQDKRKRGDKKADRRPPRLDD